MRCISASEISRRQVRQNPKNGLASIPPALPADGVLLVDSACSTVVGSMICIVPSRTRYADNLALSTCRKVSLRRHRWGLFGEIVRDVGRCNVIEFGWRVAALFLDNGCPTIAGAVFIFGILVACCPLPRFGWLLVK